MRTLPYICFTIVVGVIIIIDAVVDHKGIGEVGSQISLIEGEDQSRTEEEKEKKSDDRNDMNPASYIEVEKTELRFIASRDKILPYEEAVEEIGQNAFYPSNSANEVSLSRQRRGGCPIPTDKHAKFHCTVGGKCTTCVQTCAWGYKVNGKKSVQRTCNCKTGQWNPPFQPCKPFEKCSLRLVSAGDISCSTNHMDHGPVCKVTCKAAKGRPAVTMCTTECKEGGRWSPSPPHCVRAL